MGFTSIWHWVIVLIVVLVLFGGKGKLSALMGDFGKGLKNFKDQIKSKNDKIEVKPLKQANKTKSAKFWLLSVNFMKQRKNNNKNTIVTVKSLFLNSTK